ncbi:polysaccharide biosynthesis protein [Dyadobacter jejuensis]|uniref:Polysaccharide biosynthesis protein n=1 Tax=Dyadobacter jejuensis TaxID=1082580 RepID=A0A316A6B4_9BACT|nr:polysaccharide biosynthesis protein [Dyadobacter jejuensis]PWJ53225.1 polysaccharide biosynthesis protein [Dyadobacter jejuensis]
MVQDSSLPIPHQTLRQLVDLHPERLLQRSTTLFDTNPIAGAIRDQVIVLTGAAGSIGSELALQIAALHPQHLYLLDQNEAGLYQLEQELIDQRIEAMLYSPILCDITDGLRLQKLFDNLRPQLVFHAAAYKHVPMMEQHPYEALRTNVLGTKIIADLSLKYGVKKFIFISTDKTANPSNVMGATKKLAEQYIQTLQNCPMNRTGFTIVRFGNVLGSSGSVVPLFVSQIERGGPVTVTHPDMSRYFMTIPEACQLVLEASAMDSQGQVYLFDMGSPVRIVDLAINMIRLAGLKEYEDIGIAFVGLRPGEKLCEELCNQQEQLLPSHHPKLRMVQSRSLAPLTTDQALLNFIAKSVEMTSRQIKQMLAHYVPTYHENYG